MARNLLSEICVGAALFRGERLLLLRRTPERSFLPGCWEIPGGHVEEGESLEGALGREVREETGYEVRAGTIFDACEYTYTYADGRSVPTVEVEYLCKGNFVSDPRIDPREHTEFFWVAREELARFSLVPLVDRVVRRAFVAQGHAAGRV